MNKVTNEAKKLVLDDYMEAAIWWGGSSGATN